MQCSLVPRCRPNFSRAPCGLVENRVWTLSLGHMEKQKMELEWKLKTENGNWKRKYKSGWSLSCPNRFGCCCWLLVRMHREFSQPPVYLASFGVGTSNAALGSSLASFPGLPRLQFCILQVIKNWSREGLGTRLIVPGSSENYPSVTSLVPRPSRT